MNQTQVLIWWGRLNLCYTLSSAKHSRRRANRHSAWDTTKSLTWQLSSSRCSSRGTTTIPFRRRRLTSRLSVIPSSRRLSKRARTHFRGLSRLEGPSPTLSCLPSWRPRQSAFHLKSKCRVRLVASHSASTSQTLRHSTWVSSQLILRVCCSSLSFL